MSADLDDELWARVLLARLAEPVDSSLGARIAEVGAVRAARELLAGRSPIRTASGLQARLADDDPDDLVSSDMQRAEACGAVPIIPGTPAWPTQLEDLDDRAPLLLWSRGAADLRLVAARSIAIVGTRNATTYGETVARGWAAALAGLGWSVVSGGAFGIDAAAHRGVLAIDGVTVCVLASGVDVPYPRAHDGLLERIAASGVVVSESPPGSAAMRRRFLSRNRLIGALTRATIVVEAALRSGTKSTATEADSLGRPVLAVPGPITSPVSAGCHRWVSEGTARLVTGVDEVLASVGESRGRGEVLSEPESPPPGSRLPEREARVLDAVPLRQPATSSAISRTAGLAVVDVVAALGGLQLAGLVRRTAEGWSRR